MKKVIVFGTGLYWQNRKKYILPVCDVICFVDNNKDKWKKEIDGRIIDKPDNINNYEYDCILIMCKSSDEVRFQLKQIGVSEDKILTYNDYRKKYMNGVAFTYKKSECMRYDIIVISTEMNYNGGTIAAVYAAIALMKRGEKVLLCSEECNNKLLDELISQNIDIMIAPSLPYSINRELKQYIEECKAVLVNVFQMLPIVSQLNGVIPVLWWIHEPEELYTDIIRQYAEYIDIRMVNRVNKMAVSKIAMNNFNNRFPDKIYKSMPYGIPDRKMTKKYCSNENKKITFAVIGSIIKLKAQDTYIEAIKLFSKEEIDNSKFYIIGGYGKDDYSQNIIQQAEDNDIIVTGNLTRIEMDNIYKDIDVVVCPSREETMSIVLTEAMMYGKPCIGSDNTGMADYIQDGINGFVCKTEDVYDLYEKMRYFIHNPKDISRMGNEGRNTYEKYFTMDKFADTLCENIEETIKLFKENKKEHN